MTEFISYTIENDEEVEAKLTLAEQRLRRSLRGMIAGVANYGVYWMRLYVPKGETRRILQATDASSATWRPGGAGGGGQWEAVVGVKRTAPHAAFVASGTGIYAGRGLIRPRHGGGPGGFAFISTTGFGSGKGRRNNVLTFQKKGEPRRFVAFVTGQRAQHFLYLTFQQIRLYANARVFTLGPELLG